MSNAVWVYFREGFNPPTNVQEFLAWADAYDVNVVLLHLDGKKYANKVLVEPKIQEFIDGCIRHKMQVHGLFNALTSAPDEWISQEHKDLFCVDAHGISILDEPISGRRFFMDPNKPAVVELLKRISANILQSYPALSGLQLDFIRYYHWESSFTIDARAMGHNLSFLKQGNPLEFSVADQKVSYFLEDAKVLYDDPPYGDHFKFHHNFSYCFCDYCVEKFADNYQLELPKTLKETADKSRWILEHAADMWYAHRCAILESVVRQLQQTVKAVDLSKQLSMTVWYNSPYGNELIDQPLDSTSVVRDFGQSWWHWANQGLIDFVCPMNYWLKPESFEEVIINQLAKVDDTLPLYSGLLRSDEYPIDATELDAYKAATKKAGATGLCFFHYGTWRKNHGSS